LRTVLVAVGNPLFRDDSLGWFVWRRFKERLPAYHFLSPSLELLERLKGFDRAVIVDAVDLGLPAGRLVIKRLAGKYLVRSGAHTLSVEELLFTGYSLFPEEMPKEVYLFGVQGEDFSPGFGLTPAVERGLEELLRELEELLSDSVEPKDLIPKEKGY
jgi:hydrogenase maturation protease